MIIACRKDARNMDQFQRIDACILSARDERYYEKLYVGIQTEARGLRLALSLSTQISVIDVALPWLVGIATCHDGPGRFQKAWHAAIRRVRRARQHSGSSA